MLRWWAGVGFALALAVVVASYAVIPAVAQSWAVPDRGLRLDWESAATKRGAEIRGYVHNDLGYGVMNIRLVVESLDASGQVVTTTVGYVQGSAPPLGRLYFEVPLKALASNYRVRIAAWEPFGGGAQ